MTDSSTPEPTAPETATTEVPESSAIGPATSVIAKDETTYGTKVHFHYPVRPLNMFSDPTRQVIIQKKTLIGASRQNVAAAYSSDSPLSETRTGKKSQIEPSLPTKKDDVVDTSSNGSLSSPNTLINTPTDPSSPVNAQDERAQMQESLVMVQEIKAANQELRDENTQLRSSIVELAKILSHEKKNTAAADPRAANAEEKATAAEGRVTAAEARATAAEARTTAAEGRATDAEKRAVAAEGRATAAEGRATAAEGREAGAVGTATSLGPQMERLSEDLGVQINRAADAEAESMRVRLQLWEMQRDSLPSDDEVFQEQKQRGNDLDQTQEEDSKVGTPLDAQEYAEDHEPRDTLVEETVDLVQDVTGDVAAADSTSMADEALSAEMAAHQHTHQELDQLKAQLATKDSQLNTAKDESRRLTREIDGLHQERGERTSLLEQLDGARSRITELEASNVGRLRFRITALQTQVSGLTFKLDEANSRISELENSTDEEALRRLESRINTLRLNATNMYNMLVQQNDTIGKGKKDLKFFIRLGTKLHARVKKAEKMLKGALGRADGLMLLAEQWLPITVPAESYFRDVVDEDADNNGNIERKVQLAIEGPPVDLLGTLNTETVSERVVDDVDTDRLVSDMFNVQEGKDADNGEVADVEGGGPATNSSISPRAEDVASPSVPTATSKDRLKASEFTFSPSAPAQETRKETTDTSNKPMFAFGGTAARGSRETARHTAEKPMFRFSATSVQESRKEVPSVVASSPQGFSVSQQTAVPEVSGVQAAEKTPEDSAEWTNLEDEDKKGVTGPMIGNHDVTPNQTSANEPDTPRAEGSAQDLHSGATATLFGARTSPSPATNNNADSGSFNFTSASDINFGIATSFKAGSIPFAARPKASEAVKQDEQKEAPFKQSRPTSTDNTATSSGCFSASSSSDTNEDVSNKKTKKASTVEATDSLSVPSPSSGGKEEATKKPKPASIFEAATSVDLSSLTFDNNVAPCPSPSHATQGTSGLPDFASVGGLSFTETAAKEDNKEQKPARKTDTPLVFGVRASTNFSFSPSGVMPAFGGFKPVPTSASNDHSDSKPVEVGTQHKQKQGSTKKAAPEAFAAKPQQKQSMSRKVRN